jgi:hypothetical protein
LLRKEASKGKEERQIKKGRILAYDLKLWFRLAIFAWNLGQYF